MAAYPRKYPNGVTVYEPSDSRSSEYHKRAYRVVWKERNERRSSYALAEDEALTIAKDVVRQLTDFGDEMLAPKAGATLDQLFDYWLSDAPRELPWKDATRSNAESYVNNWFSPMIGHLRCSEWKVQHTQAILAEARRRQSSLGTQRNLRDALRNIAKVGRLSGFLPQGYDPTADVTVSRKQDVRIAGESAAFVRPELVPTAERLWEAVAYFPRMTFSAPMPQLVNALLLPMYVGGLRIGELFALERRNLDLDSLTVKVERQVTTKGKRDYPKHGVVRDAPIPEFLIEHLWLPDDPSSPMLPTVRGKGFRHSTFTRYWNRLRTDLDWPKQPCPYPSSVSHSHDECFVWNFHSLRHFYATWALSDNDGDLQAEYAPPGIPMGAGWSLRLTSRFLGHADTKTTADKYVSGRDDDVARANRQLNGGR